VPLRGVLRVSFGDALSSLCTAYRVLIA